MNKKDNFYSTINIEYMSPDKVNKIIILIITAFCMDTFPPGIMDCQVVLALVPFVKEKDIRTTLMKSKEN